jgi:hypothetical protein
MGGEQPEGRGALLRVGTSRFRPVEKGLSSDLP